MRDNGQFKAGYQPIQEHGKFIKKTKTHVNY